MMSLWRAAPLALPLLMLEVPLAAQSVDVAKYDPPRPTLPAGADTNSAGGYYAYGLGMLMNKPSVAAAAFHWASRLNPALGEPLYAKRTALLMMNRRRLGDYFTGRGGYHRSREVRAIDSLAFEARLRNPVMLRSLDLKMFEAWYLEETGQFLNQGDLQGANPAVSAWLAMSRGDHFKAAELYARVLKNKRAWSYHYDRGMAFYYMGQPDSAVASLDRFIQASREDEKKEEDVVVFYQPKAMAEYTIGYIHYIKGKRDPAKAAFERALTEDLSFAMAHAGLGDLARLAGDSATALQELELAVQLKGTDAFLRYRYGSALLGAKRPADAAQQFMEANRLEPWYAAPYYLLGIAQEAAGEPGKAIEAFETYLARSSRDATSERNTATQKVAQLRAQ
jgi:tetratricopeptide (TPR) repeat protein